MKPPKFIVELVPKTCFFTNVRSQVSQADWDWLRKQTYKSAHYQCEGCGAKGRMEAHEIWHYDDENRIQSLHSIVCLCHMCHLSHHLGFAEIQGKLPAVKKHLAKINQWSAQETELFIEGVFEVWFERSRYQWKLDLSFLDKCEVPYSLVNKNERETIAIKKMKNK